MSNYTNTADMSGVIMTASDASTTKLDVIGPPDTIHYLATLRSAVYRNTLHMTVQPHPPACEPGEAEDIFEGTCFSVQSVAVYPEEAGPSTRQPIHRQQSIEHLAQEYVNNMFYNQHPSKCLLHPPVRRD